MIDIHTHIIPGVDDGSKSLEISRKLIEQEKENGVTTIVLTPHQNEMNINKEGLLKAYSELLKNTEDMGVKLYLGSEIYYYKKLGEDLKNGRVLTLNNTKYFLVEFSTMQVTDVCEKLYDLTVIGFHPVIAHIERYPYLTKKDYDELHGMGVKIQVNTKSFKSKGFKKTVKYLLKMNYIDYIGTDCHDLEERNVEYENCLKVLKKYPEEYEHIINTIPEFLK